MVTIEVYPKIGLIKIDRLASAQATREMSSRKRAVAIPNGIRNDLEVTLHINVCLKRMTRLSVPGN